MYKNFTQIFCTPPGYIPKLLWTMKLTTILLLVSMLQVSATGVAQKITFVKKNATLKQVFTEIHKQTGYSVLLSGTKAKGDQRVDANFNNASLDEVLKKLFENQAVEYTIEDKMIVIRDKEKPLPPKAAVKPAVDSSFVLTGRVTDRNGQPLPGTSILQLNPNQTSVTSIADNDGRFKLSVEKGSKLTISSIGYVTEEMLIDNQTVINLEMFEDLKTLGEMVVIAYGTTTKTLNTGNVAVVTSQDIARQPVSNVLQSLQGILPGVMVNQSSGFASSPFSIKIRGQNSLAANVNDGVNQLSEPLYILDGVPIISAGSSSNLNFGVNKNGGIRGPSDGQSPLYGLNPSDIESISILKDADATAIYGARGANGVILITTKKGKAGPASVSANVYTGVSLQARKLNLMNTAEYLEMRKRALQNDGLEPDARNALDLTGWDQNRYTDWQKELLGTAHTTDAQLSISGGNSTTTYRISGGFNSVTPPFKGDYREQRASGSLAVTNVSFNSKLTTTAMVNFSSTTSNLPASDMTSLIFLAPNAPSLVDSLGNLNFAGWSSASGLPYEATSLKKGYRASTKNLISTVSIRYQIMSGLEFNTSLGYNISKQDQLETSPSGSFNPAYASRPFSKFGNNDSQSWIIEPNLTFSKTFGKHSLATLIGSTFQDTEIEGSSIIANGYADDALLGSLGAAASYSNALTNYTDTKFESVYARINYNYEEKYVLTLNGRRDGSSRFANGRKFGNFGSVGAAWIFSREPFVQNALPFLSLGKIRASYGLVGGDNLTDYEYLSSFRTGQTPYQSTTAFQLSRLANDQFGWTTNKKAEVALAFGFLNGRINTELARYRNRSGNQLVSYGLPSTTGFNSIITNLPAVIENKGWEFTLQTQNIKTRNVDWSTNVNISQNKNTLLSFPDLELSTYVGRYAIGRSINSLEMNQYTGVDPVTGLYIFAIANYTVSSNHTI